MSYDICLTFFGMILPMMVITFCYFNIFRTVRVSKNNVRAQKKHAIENPDDPVLYLLYTQKKKKLAREKRFIQTLVTIVILFILFWLPASIVLPLSGFWEDMPKILYGISVWCAFSNSSINSIAYGAMNKNFRSGYITLFKCIFFCCFHLKKNCECCNHSTMHNSSSSSHGRVNSPDTSTSQEPVPPKNSVSADSNVIIINTDHLVNGKMDQQELGAKEITSTGDVSMDMVQEQVQDKVLVVDMSDICDILKNEPDWDNNAVFVTKL